ncbi:MAG: energy-coupling factor transporter transmembrane component T family protein [Caldimicrobium sp.]
MLLQLHKEVHPLFQRLNEKVKFLYFFSLLILVLTSQKLAFLCLVFTIHLVITVTLIKKPKKVFKYYVEPLFIAFSIPIIKSISLFPFNFQSHLFWENLPISLKILSAFSLFLVFHLTTNFFETLQILHWLRIPLLLRELIFLTYRTLMILHKEISLIYLSQKIRLGYSNLKNSLTSFYYLIQGTFLNSLRHSETLLQSMVQRGYSFSNFPLSSSKLSKKDILSLFLMLSLWGLLWIFL